jgi:hypothetical protein
VQTLVTVNTTLDLVPDVQVRNTFKPANSLTAEWGAWRTLGPGMVGASVNLNTSQSIPASAQSRVVLDGIRHSVGGAWLSAGKLTVPAGRGGYYDISAQAAWDAATVAGSHRQLSIYKNGVSSVLHNVNGSTTLQTSTIMSTQLLAAGDVIELYVFQTTGAALNIRGGGETFMSVRLVALA